MIWSYAITTVPGRNKLCEQTRALLADAGFNDPHISFDYQRLGPYANWVLAAWRIYLTQPLADRFAIFQDDLITYRNLREYLERTPYPKRGYLNLYSWPSNEKLAPHGSGFYLGYQLGKGALALVFNRPAITALFQQQPFVAHPQEPRRPTSRIDGIVSMSMTNAGFLEYVHTPSLVQHTGLETTIKGKNNHREEDLSKSFRGSDFDALDLLKEERCQQL